MHKYLQFSPHFGLKIARYLLAILALTFIYSAASWLSHFLEAGQRGAMPIPLAAGVALTALLWFGVRLWPGIILGNVVLKLSLSVPYSLVFIDATAATLQAILAVWLLNRLKFPKLFLQLRDVLLFMAVTLFISPFVGASISAIGLLINPIPLDYVFQIWITIWFSDGVGMLIITAALLTWKQIKPPLITHYRQWLELIFILSCLILVSGVSLTIDYGNRYLFFYMILPFAIWVAIRFEQHGATLASVLVAMILLTGGLNRLHLEGRLEAGTVGLMLEIAFIALTALTAYLVAAAYTQRRQAEEDVICEKELALATLHSIANAVMTTDKKGYIRYLNPAAESILQWSHSQALEKPIAEIFHIKNLHNDQLENFIHRCLHGVINPPHACLLLTREGQEFPINMSAAPIRHRDGHIAGVIVLFHSLHQDSLERQGIASHFSQQTLDLYPRPIFEQLLSNLLRAFSLNQVKENYLLLYLESDLFKTVYSRYGQAASELLWQQWIGLIKKRIRYDDMLTRLNHQHVAILLKDCASHQAESVCQHILETMQGFEFIWQQQRLHGSLAIGAVAVTAEYGRVDDLLQRAEQACQVARDNPELHCYVALSHANEARNAQAMPRLISVHQYWQNEVKLALSEQRLYLYQQAMLILSNRQILGTEISLRLQNAEQQWIDAETFLPLLQNPTQLMQLDRWTIQETFAYLATHREQLPEGYLISFNVNADTLTDSNFAEFLRQELRQFKLKPWQFCFEISEAAAQLHQDIMVDFIKNLRQLGCQVALDEFNHQSISLLRLREWPINYLKLDGRWLDTVHEDNFAEHLLMSIYDLCQLLRIHLVATHVENEATLALLQRLNIPFAQGLLLAPPTPLK
ncbi:EAL domain-containing protein [Thioflexithrix psekupsensis]|uniref:EAL domain-containing protein n=1 Tax=Thioflexithrix psekupsensis TaxID=1570016 RepID=A0A251X6N5_9GAMM|nr:EAL domain-containing protein [Thioflexithrix psekupsensis]OUD13257.1 hypothetical protein TPSD3_11540 [Thioflexithrix psekupsensis]